MTLRFQEGGKLYTMDKTDIRFACLFCNRELFPLDSRMLVVVSQKLPQADFFDKQKVMEYFKSTSFCSKDCAEEYREIYI